MNHQIPSSKASEKQIRPSGAYSSDLPLNTFTFPVNSEIKTLPLSDFKPTILAFNAPKPLRKHYASSSFSRSVNNSSPLEFAPVATSISLSRPASAASAARNKCAASIKIADVLPDYDPPAHNSTNQIPKKVVTFQTNLKSLSKSSKKTTSSPSLNNLKKPPKNNSIEKRSSKSQKLGFKPLELKKSSSSQPTLYVHPIISPEKQYDKNIVSEEKNSLNELDQNEDVSKKIDEYFSHSDKEYIITPFQLDLFNKLYPPKEEIELGLYKPYAGPPLYLSQAYRFNHFFNLSDLQIIANKIVSIYKILQTRFFRNEKILDADVIGFLDHEDWKSSRCDSLIESIDPDEHVELSIINEKSLTLFAKNWMKEHYEFTNLFKVLHLKSSKPTQKINASASEYLIFIGSTVVMDTLSCTIISRQIMNMYQKCFDLRRLGKVNSEILSFIDGYEKREKTPFSYFAQGCVETKFAMNFWRAQCIDTVVESIDHLEKEEFEAKIEILRVERQNLEASLGSLKTRKSNLEKDSNRLLDQRKKLDSGQNGDAKMTTYVDRATGETLIISIDAKNALIRAVLGFDSATDDIESFLDKHSVPKDVQRKIGASELSVEEFSELSESELQNFGILTKDKRKILALVDYLSSRIKESLYEQHKVKSTVERHILKVKRDLERVVFAIRDTTEKLEINDDMTIRLNFILNPPVYEARVPSLKITSENPESKEAKENYNTLYSSELFTVNEENLGQLRDFREGVMLSKKAARQKNTGSESSSTGLISSSDSEDVDSTDPAVTKRLIKSVDAVCLSAFAILLKHISGNDKFLIGLNQSYRTSDILVGPLSDTVPIKLDLSKKRLEFKSLFSSLCRLLFHARQQGAACPSSKIASKFKQTGGLPVRFQFISYRETLKLLESGLTINDLLLNDEFEVSEKIGGDRLWSKTECDDFDLKVILVEGKDSIQGCFRYRTDKYESSRIQKWVGKFMATLESIEYSTRKIRISTMISRFYHSMWHSSGYSLASSPSFPELQSQLSLGSAISLNYTEKEIEEIERKKVNHEITESVATLSNSDPILHTKDFKSPSSTQESQEITIQDSVF